MKTLRKIAILASVMGLLMSATSCAVYVPAGHEHHGYYKNSGKEHHDNSGKHGEPKEKHGKSGEKHDR
jgi:hypothetical protein